MSSTAEPSPRDPRLAALVIAALALAGAIGAVKAINATCRMPTGLGLGGAPIAPLEPAAAPASSPGLRPIGPG